MVNRRGLTLITLMLTGALLVSACGTKTPTPTSLPTQNVQQTPAKREPQGTMTIVQGAEPDLLDPLFSDGSTEYTIVVNIMDGLFTTGKNLEIVPVLAESYQVIDENTWEFKLREGVVFHNGEPFTAQVVKFTYDRAMDKDLKVRNEWAKDINLKEVQVVDDYTVRFITSDPTPHLLARIANDHYMYPPKYTQEVGKDGFTKKPIGTGPYKFKQWDKGSRILLEANTEYWGGAPSIKDVVWRFIPEDGARIIELETGGADLIVNVAPDQVSQLKGKPKTDVISIEGGRRIYLGLKTTGDGPTAKVQVRQALNYGIDVETISKTLLAETVGRMPNPVNPPNRNPEVKGYRYDPDKAKQLLAEAGYPNGFEADLEAYLGVAMKDREVLQTVVADLRKIGVNLNLKILERKTFNERVAKRQGAPIYLRTTAGGFDMGVDLSLFRPDHAGNATGWEPPAFVDLFKKVQTTVDAVKRREHGYAIQKLIVAEAPWVFLVNQPEIYGVSKRIKGFNPQGDERIRVVQLSLAN